MQNQISKWLLESRPEDRSHRIFQEEAVVLGYENLVFPILIISAGIAAALAVLVVETCRKKCFAAGVQT